ncbi:MAG: hypothetical protein GTO18_12380 [Anaerolineales bacterium]|nr:hypothetical protein [Anaerolineales bacterium]
MSPNISCSVAVDIVGGPELSITQNIAVDAYDRIDAVVPATTPGVGGAASTPGKAKLEVQPGGTGQVQFLLITSSVYDSDLTFKVDGEPADPDNRVLDAPLFLMGAGTVSMLASTQKNFEFSNDITPPTAASIVIFVGRKATS